MTKTAVAALLLNSALFIRPSSVSAAAADKPPWKGPWKDESTSNLQTLVTDGYEILGTGSSVPGLGGVFVDVIYFRKGKSL